MAYGFAKCVLVVVNVIITIIGLAFLGAGLFIKFSGKVEEQVDNVVKAIPDLPSKFNLQDSNQDLDQAALDLNKLAGRIAIGLCIGGGILLFIGICGCCGVFCKSKKLLICYIVIVITLIIVQLGVAVILYTGKFETHMKKTIKKGIVDNFIAIDSLETDSVLLNVLQLYFGCCGVDNVEDFYDVKSWDRNRTVFVEQTGTNETVYLQTPFSCCKVVGSFPNVEPVDKECATSPDDTNSNKDIGCYEDISDEVNMYKKYIMAGAGGAVGLQILIAIAAIVVCHSLYRQGEADFRRSQ